MGKFVLTDVYIELDGHDLSNYGFNIDTPSEKDEVDVSGFNPNNTRESLVGQRQDSITAQFTQDFASGGPHDIIWTIYENDQTVGVKIRPTSAVVGATNPELAGNVKVRTYNGLTGALNARAEVQVELLAADSDGLTWTST
jgi:hypothetical protein